MNAFASERAAWKAYRNYCMKQAPSHTACFEGDEISHGLWLHWKGLYAQRLMAMPQR